MSAIGEREIACSLRNDGEQLQEQQQAVTSWSLGQRQPEKADEDVDRAQVEILRTGRGRASSRFESRQGLQRSAQYPRYHAATAAKH